MTSRPPPLPWLEPGDPFPAVEQSWDVGPPAPGLLAAGGAARGVSGNAVWGYLSGNGLLSAVGGGWVVQVNQYGRWLALLCVALFGLTLLLPQLSERLTRPLVAAGSPRALRASPQTKVGCRARSSSPGPFTVFAMRALISFCTHATPSSGRM